MEKQLFQSTEVLEMDNSCKRNLSFENNGICNRN